MGDFMSWEFMMPVESEHTNGVLKAPPGSKDVYDLPVIFSNVGVGSEWTCSFWARVKFLFHGKIIFMSQSNTHPPVYFVIGTNYFTGPVLGKGDKK
jgi:hypothetical protein